MSVSEKWESGDFAMMNFKCKDRKKDSPYGKAIFHINRVMENGRLIAAPVDGMPEGYTGRILNCNSSIMRKVIYSGRGQSQQLTRTP